MAFIRSYEIGSTGMIVPEAYYVVSHVDIDKRIKNILPPVDPSTDTGYTSNIDPTDEAQMIENMGPPVYWKKGYVGTIAIEVWASKAAREDEDKEPIGFIGDSPVKGPSIDAQVDEMRPETLGTDGMDHWIKFFVDVESGENYLTQAYRHLRQTSYFANAIED